MNSNVDARTPNIVFHTRQHTYKVISYPKSLDDEEHTESILWMRTVSQHLKTIKTSVNCKVRTDLFKSKFGFSHAKRTIFNHRYPPERSLNSRLRVSYQIIPKRIITAETANKRGTKRCRRAAMKMKTDQEAIFKATVTLIRYGLLKSGGKYERFRRVTKRISQGRPSGTYGISLAQYPNADTVEALANAIYKHSDILTNSPDWVIKYRKGRLKLVNDQLFLPTQQVTISKIPLQEGTADTQSKLTEDILQVSNTAGLVPRVIKVRKGDTSAAAYVYFDSAYEARCAVQSLRQIGLVSLGQTIVTARVVASKVINVIHTLLSEADGILAQAYPITSYK